MLENLITGENLLEETQKIILALHKEGPISSGDLEKLSFIKKFHPDFLAPFESKIISLMGLFYKASEPKSVIEEIYSIFSEEIKSQMGTNFTPVQADAFSSIQNTKFFSFSAPTSSGKSFLFRELITKTIGDIIFVVPSRALIAEYIQEVRSIVPPSTLVLQFIDNINKAKINRRIFIITPERGAELFKHLNDFNIELFLFDEAQISEEEIRGMTFDAFVRRAEKIFPNAKKVFAHPFVKNPEAQILKHPFGRDGRGRRYDQNAVGKVFLTHKNGNYNFFSPNFESKKCQTKSDPVFESLKNNGTLLVYTSKAKIYNGNYLLEFSKYIDLCPEIKNEAALKVIEELRSFIGASSSGGERHSELIERMKRGIVIHHGSLPLNVRLLIEKFIKNNYAKICFSTSTLAQGINMPFDVVWLDHFGQLGPLGVKNFIGRAGRTTTEKNTFDFGYTIIHQKSLSTFLGHYKEAYLLSKKSKLDADIEKVPEDFQDIVEALKENTFDDELHLTKEQVERISNPGLDMDIIIILKNFIKDKKIISGKEYINLPDTLRREIKEAFKNIFIKHLRRPDLTQHEKSVLSTAIPILLWRVQGKSFREIVSLRFSFLSKRDDRRKVMRKLRMGEISPTEAKAEMDQIKVRYTELPTPLPKKNAGRGPTFRNVKVEDLIYDLVVFDTYDYLDKVVSFSIIDPVCAALSLYNKRTPDDRVKPLINYIRHGTNDEIEIWLLRYGFGFEEIEWIKEHVDWINDTQISFKHSIQNLEKEKLEVIERYL